MCVCVFDRAKMINACSVNDVSADDGAGNCDGEHALIMLHTHRTSCCTTHEMCVGGPYGSRRCALIRCACAVERVSAHKHTHEPDTHADVFRGDRVFLVHARPQIGA